jgi:ABC-2 type transport system permease protein
MSFRRIRAIARKEINHIIRDRGTFALVLLVPTVLLLMMAYALTVELQHIPIAVLDNSRTPASRSFVQRLIAGDDLDLYAQVGTMDEIEGMLLRGQVKAALILDPAFAEELLTGRGIALQVIIDGTEPESGAFAVEHIVRRAEEYVTGALANQLQALGLSAESLQPIDLRVRTWYNPSLKPRNDLIPGLVSIVLGFPALSVALTLAHEREHGTMEQLMATPIGRAELLLGKMLPYILVGLLNVIFIPILSILWFRVPFNGSFLLFFGLSAVFLFAILGVGLVVGVFMRTQAAALALSFLLIFFPGFFMTGIFFPLASMPEEVRLEALGLPGTHYAIITRGIFLPGVGLDVLWPYTVMMFGLGVAFTGLAALFFKKRLA